MGKGKKRKSYYSDFKDAKRWRGVLSVGMKGFLCTCNMRVKECIREAYNLLNDFADKLDGPEKIEEPSESIEDELEKELKDMRQKPNDKKFQVVETGADNTVFIKTTLEDPKKITDEIFSEIYTSKQNRSRFLLRLVPIDVTCKAYIEDIRKAADEMFDLPFKCDPLTFNVFYKARYNNSLLRDEVLSAMVTLVKDRNHSHKVDLTKPQKTVIVEVIKGVCCLSVVNDFYKYRKYNLSEAAKPETMPETPVAEVAEPETKPETPVAEVAEPETKPEAPVAEAAEPETKPDTPVAEVAKPKTHPETPVAEVDDSIKADDGQKNGENGVKVLDSTPECTKTEPNSSAEPEVDSSTNPGDVNLVCSNGQEDKTQ